MEQWSKIKGFEGYHGVEDWEISDLCNVRQFGRPIEPKVDSQGYRYIQFCRGGELQRVHRLMLLAFVGPPPEPHFIAVLVDGTWRWGLRDEVKLVRHKPKKIQAPKKPRKRRGPDSKEHFRAWLAEYIRLENS